MESTTGLPNPKKLGKNGKLLPFSPFPFHPASTSFTGGSGGEPIEEQPLWLDDLLNDSETISHRGHRRSASDSYAYLGEAAVALSLDDESEFVNAYFGSSPASQNVAKFKDLDSNFSQTKVNSLAHNNIYDHLLFAKQTARSNLHETVDFAGVRCRT